MSPSSHDFGLKAIHAFLGAQSHFLHKYAALSAYCIFVLDFVSLQYFCFLSTPKYTGDQSSSSYPLPGSGGPSPTYLPSVSDSQSHQQGDYYGGDASSYTSHEQPQVSEAPQAQPSEQRAPSPARRSMFDFVSPFDALTNPPASQQSKRKPIPAQPPSNSASTTSDTVWNLTVDPKRKSVENLMDQLTRGQVPPSAPAQSVTAQFDPYAPNEDVTQQVELAQTKASRPLPPQPSQLGASSPRASPPKAPVQQQQQQPQQPQRQQARRSIDSPIGPPGNQNQFQSSQRDKEGSPLPTGFRYPSLEPRGKAASVKGKNSPRCVWLDGYLSRNIVVTVILRSVQQQTIVFDVSQPLYEIKAPQESVKSTAIALVKVDSTFLPGTTIGATHWVAYAMTKGGQELLLKYSGCRIDCS